MTDPVPSRTVVFRPAVPSDKNWAPPLIISSAETRFGALFGFRKLSLIQYLEEEFESGWGLYSFKHHICITHEVQNIGIMALYRGLTAPLHAIGTTYHVCKSMGFNHAISTIRRRMRASGDFPPLSYNVAYGDNLFINPQYRGRGFGRAAMEQLFRLSVQMGCQYFVGDVEQENHDALLLYDSLGMESVKVMHSRPPNVLCPMVRIRKDVTEFL